MPYVDKKERKTVDGQIDKLIMSICDNDPLTLPGVLNYVVSRIIAHACSPDASWRYKQIMEAIGTLECAKLELYRRVAGPKEDLAIDENGDTPEYAAWMRNRFPGDYQ